MKFDTIEQLHNFTITTCQQLHPEDLDLIFISGSYARNELTEFSDLDYTACVSNQFSHPVFKFFVVVLENIPRIVSIYFYKTSEFQITPEQLTEENMLWEKGMMQDTNSKFIWGNEQIFTDVCDFYRGTTYDKKPKMKTIHKSTGKLLELIVKVKKYQIKKDLPMMIYYGMKIAEHARRLVFECNPALTLLSESKMCSAIKNMTYQPIEFGELYSEVSRITNKETSISSYFQSCKQLVENTLQFIVNNPAISEPFTEDLLDSPIFRLLCHISKV